MAKAGIINDYDLMANAEPSAKGQTCAICGDSPMRFQWSDYHGEGMCQKCGTPYQLRAGSEAQKEEGAYPYINLDERWVPVVREYHEETGAFACLGQMLGRAPGREEFFEWAQERHPELFDASPAQPEPAAGD